jgi:hypothetical protein
MGSEPHVRHAAAVAAEVVELHEPVEVFHGDGGHGVWFGEPQIDRDARAKVALIGDATVGR